MIATNDQYTTQIDPETGVATTYRPGGGLFSISPGTFTSEQKREIVNLQSARDKVNRDDRYGPAEKAVALSQIEGRLARILPASMPNEDALPDRQFIKRTYTDPATGRMYDMSNPKMIKDITGDHKPNFKDFQATYSQIAESLQKEDKDGNIIPADEGEVLRRTRAVFNQYQDFLNGGGGGSQNQSNPNSYGIVNGPKGVTTIGNVPEDVMQKIGGAPPLPDRLQEKYLKAQAVLDSGKIKDEDNVALKLALSKATDDHEKERIVDKFLAVTGQPAPQAGANILATAINKKTGKRIGWNGKQWVAVN